MSAPAFALALDWNKKVSSGKLKKKPANPLITVLAVVLVVLVGSVLFRASHEGPSEKMFQVVTVTRDMPPGTRLGLMNLKLLAVPRRFFTPDMVTSLNYAAGSVARSYIAPGEPIVQTQLFAKDTSLPMTLETHERAITLQLSDDALIDHCLNPDDRVDVLCVSSNSKGKKFTRTVVADARVLMCVQKNQLMARHLGSSSSNMVTLAVTPDLAEALTEAVEVGKIRLTLRNRLARIEPRLKGIGPDDLLPASAFDSDETARETASQQGVLPLPAIAAPPLPDLSSSVNQAPTLIPAPAPTGPVQWVVEMFSGSHKETLGVPLK